jgi:hypothetical protein
MKNLTFLFLISLLVLSACHKDAITHISGHVTTLGTEDPVVDAKLVLFGGIPDDNFSNPSASYYRIDSTYTDATGYYEFNFDAGDYVILDVVAEKESYFSQSVQQGLIAGRGNVADIVLEPFAWVKFHVKNVMPMDDGDIISVWGSWGGGGSIYTSGENVDETLIEKIRGNIESTIHWSITENGIKTTTKQDIYFPAQDTTLFEIFY